MLCGETQAQQCRLVLFQDSDFARDLEDSKSKSGGMPVSILGSHTFVPTSWDVQEIDCSFDTVLQNAEIIALDAGLGMNRIPGLTRLGFGD